MVGGWHRLQAAESDLEAAREMVNDRRVIERELAQAEVAQAEQDVARLGEELRLLLVPRDPNAGRNVIMEIRGAEGGEEANIFAKDLYEMYTRYAADQRMEGRGALLQPLRAGRAQRDHLRGQG